MFTPHNGVVSTVSIALMMPTLFFCHTFFCHCFCSSQLNIVKLAYNGKLAASHSKLIQISFNRIFCHIRPWQILTRLLK